MLTKKEITKAIKDYRSIGELLIGNTIGYAIQGIPNLESVSINCNTPYFNDGDECVFSANTDYPDFCDKIGTRIDLEKDDEEKIINLLGCFDDEFYRGVFGDHVTVIFFKNGKVKTETSGIE